MILVTDWMYNIVELSMMISMNKYSLTWFSESQYVTWSIQLHNGGEKWFCHNTRNLDINKASIIEPPLNTNISITRYKFIARPQPALRMRLPVTWLGNEFAEVEAEAVGWRRMFRMIGPPSRWAHDDPGFMWRAWLCFIVLSLPLSRLHLT